MRGSGPEHCGKMRLHSSDGKLKETEEKLYAASKGKLRGYWERMLLMKSSSASRREERLSTVVRSSITLLVNLFN